MKPFKNSPVTAVRLVCTDDTNRKSKEYEVYILTPVCIGRATRSYNKVMVEGNAAPFHSMDDAVDYLMTQHGITDIAGVVRGYKEKKAKRTRPKEEPTIEVEGTDMIAQSIWLKFCELRDFDPRDKNAICGKYGITKKEATELGLEYDRYNSEQNNKAKASSGSISQGKH